MTFALIALAFIGWAVAVLALIALFGRGTHLADQLEGTEEPTRRPTHTNRINPGA